MIKCIPEKRFSARRICAWTIIASSVVLICVSYPQLALSQNANAAILGMQKYNSSNFTEAKIQLEVAVKQNPKSAQLQYVLGNTYFQLGEKAKAIKAYEACLTLAPTPQIEAYCKKMLAHTSPSSSTTEPKALTADKKVGGGDEENETPADPAQAKIAAHRRAIMAAAEAECKKIRKEAEVQKAEAEANGNRWVRSVSENTLQPTISKEDSSAIQNECEQKISRIMDDAKRHANSVVSP